MDLDSELGLLILATITALFLEEVSPCCLNLWALFVAQELLLSYPELFAHEYLYDLTVLASRYVAPLGGLDRLLQILMHWCPEDDEIDFNWDDELIPGMSGIVRVLGAVLTGRL